MLLLRTDEFLDKVEQLVEVVVKYGSGISVEEQRQLAGNGRLIVGQQVLARSSANDGHWRNANVISAGHR